MWRRELKCETRAFCVAVSTLDGSLSVLTWMHRGWGAHGSKGVQRRAGVKPGASSPLRRRPRRCSPRPGSCAGRRRSGGAQRCRSAGAGRGTPGAGWRARRARGVWGPGQDTALSAGALEGAVLHALPCLSEDFWSPPESPGARFQLWEGPYQGGLGREGPCEGVGGDYHLLFLSPPSRIFREIGGR